MPNFKSSRMAEDLKREITALIRELKDPRVTGSMITVVRVEIASDLSYAKAYISSLQGKAAAAEAVKGLQSAAGYIRRELGARLHIRKSPELKFIADDSVRESIEMFKKLEKADTKEREEHEN
ncbi:MAG: 30S ribosome-binding factor RbfA [Clostridia bacterium]|nr:30S ribosome-binding factor RbfA [Clostridia bacterium]